MEKSSRHWMWNWLVSRHLPWFFARLTFPGQATTVLTETFEEVVGVDPSQKMVDQANAGLNNQDKSKLSYVKSSAESLPFLSEGSVDLVTVGKVLRKRFLLPINIAFRSFQAKQPTGLIMGSSGMRSFVSLSRQGVSQFGYEMTLPSSS